MNKKLHYKNYLTLHSALCTLHSNSGQVILILLLVMTVALAIGLSVVQRSITDISTSTRLEDSTRAFSAAEAGIEKALTGSTGNFSVDFSKVNRSTANVTDSGLVPDDKQALEYPPIVKEEVAHVWLADPNTDLNNSATKYYDQSSIDIYWGNPLPLAVGNKPAIEITVIYQKSDGTYESKLYFLDSDSDSTRAGSSGNGFQDVSGSCGLNITPINTIFSSAGVEDRKFYCKSTLDFSELPHNSTLMILRARILYTSSAQSFAVKPLGSCSSDNPLPCSLPRQAQIIQSTGSAGDTQRTVQLFKIIKVVPFYFDYAIFSAGSINK